MAFVQAIYSGSSGNCTLIRDNGTSLLVDMGRNCKETVNALYSAGVSAKDISGILITHEHSDHIAGLKVFLKHYPVPLFGSPATMEYLYNNMLVPDGEVDIVPVEPEEEMIVGDIAFTGFRTSHDSVDCLGYRFAFSNGKSAAIATDLGYVSESVKERLRGCDFVGLESNYDTEMLRNGGYPAYLKRRIASRTGHLSNADCAGTLLELALGGVRKFMLMHLSKENNAPSVALTTCLGIFENAAAPDCVIGVAPRYVPGTAAEV